MPSMGNAMDGQRYEWATLLMGSAINGLLMDYAINWQHKHSS